MIKSRNPEKDSTTLINIHNNNSSITTITVVIIIRIIEALVLIITMPKPFLNNLLNRIYMVAKSIVMMKMNPKLQSLNKCKRALLEVKF